MAGACPGLCATAGDDDDDDDDVLDFVECWFCEHYAGTALAMDPTDPDSDNDNHPDALDAYPGDDSAWGDLEFSPSCADPTGSGNNDFRDPEFNEADHLVTWVKDDPNNPFFDPELWVATVETDGDFASPVKVDDTNVLSVAENSKNGSEWLYDDTKGSVILYAKASTTKTIYYAYKSGGSWVKSLLVSNGTAPMGTLVASDTTPGVWFIRKIGADYMNMFCPFNGCSGSYPKAGPVINPVPPDLMRFAEGRASGDWLLVGVDYDSLDSSIYRRLRSWAPSPDSDDLISDDEDPNKYTGWMFRVPVGETTKDLVITHDLMFTSPHEGPGVVRIHNATDNVWWQTIPVGPLTHPYVESAEPFLGDDGNWYVTFAASTVAYGGGPSQVILAQIDPDGVTDGGVNVDMVVRRVDAGGGPPFTAKWKDPEGFTYPSYGSWVYTTSNNERTVRCITGI